MTTGAHEGEQPLVTHLPLVLALGLMVLTRVAFLLLWPVAQISDYGTYYLEASAYAGLGEARPTALHAQGPKLFFGLLFGLFGNSLEVVATANLVLFLAAVLLVYRAVVRDLGRPSGALLALVWATSMSEAYFGNLVCTELLGTFFVAALFAMLANDSSSIRSALAIGAVAGLATYNRSSMLPIGVLVFAFDLVRTRGFPHALNRAFVAQGVALLVVIPLCALNLHFFGRFTPLIANSGALWYGNNPEAGPYHRYARVPEDLPPGSPERQALASRYASFYVNPDTDMTWRGLTPYEIDDVRRAYGLAYVRANPVRYLQLIRARIWKYFSECTYGEAPYKLYDPSDPAQPRWPTAHRRIIETAMPYVALWFQVLMVGATLGLLSTVAFQWRVVLTRPSLLAAMMLVAWYSTPYLLTLAANRYHIPILGLLWLFLAHGMVLAVGCVAGFRRKLSSEPAADA